MAKTELTRKELHDINDALGIIIMSSQVLEDPEIGNIIRRSAEKIPNILLKKDGE